MGKTRQKKVIIQGTVTRERAEEAFAEYALADAKDQQIRAKMDEKMAKIREEYQDELAKLEQQKKQNFEVLEAFAMGSREEFGKKKSLELAHGTIGFRTGTPKLKTLKGFTWASVTNLLKEYLPAYVRTIEEPAKDKLLADREDPGVLQQFNKVGIYVDQDETFYVEPKKELAEATI